jgi:hypothetical protein
MMGSTRFPGAHAIGIIEQADKNAAAKLQIQLVRETLAAQMKAVEGAAKIIGH